MEENWMKRVWRLMTPELVYEAACMAVELVFCLFWGATIADDYITEEMAIDAAGLSEALLELMVKYAMLMQSIGALVAIVFLSRMYFKDYKQRRYFFDKTQITHLQWLMIIPAGICYSISGNMLLNLTDFVAQSESYQQSAELLFSGPIIIQILGIGILIPVCEEFVFRGLVYMRMRQYIDVNVAILMSSLIFAVVHGNMVQGIYAFVAGVLFSYLFEKYGSLKAPVIAHVAANLFSLGMGMVSWPENSTLLLGMGVVAAAAVFGMIILIDRSVKVSRVYAEDMR